MIVTIKGPEYVGSGDYVVQTNNPVKGIVVSVYIEPVTGCLTDEISAVVETAGIYAPTRNILTETLSEGAWYNPREVVHDPEDGDEIVGYYNDGIPVEDIVKVTVTDLEEGDSVNVYLMVL